MATTQASLTGVRSGETAQPAKASATPQRASRRAAGNQAMLRRKCAAGLGHADAPEEREADRLADAVLGGGASGSAASPSSGDDCPECAAKGEGKLRRKPQARPASDAGPVPASVGRVLASEGAPLPAASRAFFEPRFGAPLDAVRVHTDAEAARSASDVGALAYAVGEDIVFARDRYAPGTAAGDRLLAHELAHVVAEAPHVVRREDDVLESMTLTLVSKDPPVFNVRLAFKDKPAEFEAKLSASRSKLGSLRPGTEHIDAGNWDDQQAVTENAVLFGLPDRSDEYLWFSVEPANVAALVRARKALAAHGQAPLEVRDYSDAPKDPEAKKGDGGDKAAPPEDWLMKEMMPAVEGSLAERYKEVQHGRLIPYSPTKIRELESNQDVSMIQVEREGKGREIAGHVRVLRSQWVSQSPDAQKKYAADTADAIVAKLNAAGKQERLKSLDSDLKNAPADGNIPDWAVKLREEIEKKLTAIRTSAPTGKAPDDLPDRTLLVSLGDEVRLKLFVEKEAANKPGTMVWNTGLVTPQLTEEQARDIDALVRTVRAQTAMLRARQIDYSEEKDGEGLTNLLMPAIPSEITATDLNANGATATGATNLFRMSVRYDGTFSLAGGRDTLNMVGVNQQLGIREIDFKWKVAPLGMGNAQELTRGARPAQPWLPAAAGDVQLYYDLSNSSIDQAAKVSIVRQKVDTAAIMASNAYPVAETNHGELSYAFPKVESVYLVSCEVTPRPYTDAKFRLVFPPSRAAYPVRVLTSDHLAGESVRETPDKIAEDERQRAAPDLSDKERAELDRKIKDLKEQEAGTQKDVTKAASAQIAGRIERMQALREWLIADRKIHPTTVGTDKEDPLLVRLSMADKRHDSHHLEAFQELSGFYGSSAYLIDHLEETPESEAGQRNVLNQYIVLLRGQKGESDKLIGKIGTAEGRFDGGKTQQVVATLVVAETGKKVPLLLLLGEDKEGSEDRAKTGKHKYLIVDMTLAASPIYEEKKQIYAGAEADSPKDAMRSAFLDYGGHNEFDEGTLYYRYGGESEVASVPNTQGVTGYAKKVAMALAVIGMIASVVASGGATTPAVATVIAVITLANAALAILLSGQEIARRHSADTLELDIDSALAALNILASLVGIGGLARGAQLGRAAQAAGTAARTAQIMGQIEKLGEMMLLFDTAVLGTTAVLTAAKVSQDVSRIRKLGLPKEQEDAVLRQIAADALLQGGMLAFQSVMLARAHYEMYKAKLEKSDYKSIEERGWVDSEGKVTEKAPPSLRATGTSADMPGEKPPVSLDSDMVRVKQSLEQGKAIHDSADPEYDLRIPFQDENSESHQFRRRREDGTWCRHSGDPFCYITKEDKEQIDRDIQAILDKLDALGKGAGEEQPKGPAETTGAATKPVIAEPGMPGKSWGRIGADAATLTQTLEATVDQAIKDLRARLGKQWLPPWIYGTKLHKAAADLFKTMKLPQGWRALVDQPLRLSGEIDPAVASMTVRDLLGREAPWLVDQVPQTLLDKKVGSIEPDLVLVAPDGTRIVWDLAPGMTPEHLGKTIVYSQALSTGGGGRFQIGETYYRPQGLIEINTTAQGRFKGTTGTQEGARVTLKDDALLSLVKANAGKGTPVAADLPTNPKARAIYDKHLPEGTTGTDTKVQQQGYHGSVEKVSGDKVVGQVLDTRTGEWVDTKTYTIHYTENGLFVRPETE